ncbi:hypothetical protein ILUMI_18510 [Ignelater luminosus]|uniref:Transposase n=1 Tax=Ignelater luminosus TaxID=2038154 RepID=A0A8K0CHV5_IGNLU|nr:hypothetical protein ILUMI_18510 [Ignelater luminosus]
MLGEDRNFSKTEYRLVIKYLSLKGLSEKEIYDDMSITLEDQCPSYSTIKNWVTDFERSRKDVTDEKRPGRLISASTQENIDAVHDMILKNRRIGLKRISETLNISYRRGFHIADNEFKMRKLFANEYQNVSMRESE